MIRVLFPLIFLAATSSAQITGIAVTSAADYSIGLPNGGAVAALFCTGLNVTGITTANGAPLPYILSGVQVSVGGTPAPLYAVASLGSYQQINFEVPGQFTQTGAPPVAQVVVTQGALSGSAAIQINNASPGQFFQLPPTIAGSPGFGIFQRVSDYSLITPHNPAQAGDVLAAYLTGLPFLQPLPPDGYPASSIPLSVVILPTDQDFTLSLNLYIDGNYSGTSPLFMGLSPGSVGLAQINFIVPALSSGTHQVTLGLSECRFVDPLCSLTSSTPVLLSFGTPVP